MGVLFRARVEKKKTLVLREETLIFWQEKNVRSTAVSEKVILSVLWNMKELITTDILEKM